VSDHLRLFIRVTLVVAFAITIPCTLASGPRNGSFPVPPEEVSARPLEQILNYPFSTQDDMRSMSELCAFLLVLHKSREAEPTNSPNTPVPNFLREVAAFTTTEVVEGEQLSIVKFGESDDKAIRRLRDEVHLPSPEGGAVLRVYYIKRAMPEPIHALFREQVQGITRWCRFVGVNAEDKSREEIKDTISHELAHAYICSILGLDSERLPPWFHEGVALYLSDARDRYVSQTGFGIERIASSTADYEEYHLVFRYLDSALAQQGVAEFIRQAVQDKSVDAALHRVGVSTYGGLRERAVQWDTERKDRYARMVWIILALTAAAGLLWAHRRRLHKRAQVLNDLHRAEQTARARAEEAAREVQEANESESFEGWVDHGQRAMQDMEELALAMVAKGRALAKQGKRSQAQRAFEEAWRTAAQWSPRVRKEAQKAENEMNGIFL
jgi:hypothetical protein